MEEEEVQVTPLDSALMLEQAELVNLLLDHQAITMDRIYNIAATRIQVNTQLWRTGTLWHIFICQGTLK